MSALAFPHSPEVFPTVGEALATEAPPSWPHHGYQLRPSTITSATAFADSKAVLPASFPRLPPPLSRPFPVPVSLLQRGWPPRHLPLLGTIHLSPPRPRPLWRSPLTTPPSPVAILPLPEHFSASHSPESVDLHVHHFLHDVPNRSQQAVIRVSLSLAFSDEGIPVAPTNPFTCSSLFMSTIEPTPIQLICLTCRSNPAHCFSLREPSWLCSSFLVYFHLFFDRFLVFQGSLH